MALTSEQLKRAAGDAGKKLAKSYSVNFWMNLAKGHDAKAIAKFAMRSVWHLAHPNSDAVWEFKEALRRRHKTPESELAEIDWKSNVYRNAFSAAFVDATLARLQNKKSARPPARLIKRAKGAGGAAGKTAVLDDIVRGRGMNKAIDDMADDAWEHDGRPALEEAASESEAHALEDTALCDAYLTAFKAAVAKRLR
jgi:hypothetical protein